MLYEYHCDVCNSRHTHSYPIGTAPRTVRFECCSVIATGERRYSPPVLITETFKDRMGNGRMRGEDGRDQVARMKQDEKNYEHKHKNTPTPKKEVSMLDIGQKMGVFA